MDSTDDVRQWERKTIVALLALLITVCGVWAGVVWSSSDKVLARLDQLAIQMNSDRLEQAQYRMALERRLTIQEQQMSLVAQRQSYVIDTLRQQGRGVIP